MIRVVSAGLWALGVLALAGAAPGAVRAQEASLAAGEHHTVVNGVRHWYRVAGRTDGTPVVFLHGGPGQGSQTFARFAGPALEPDLRMIYLDQRGSGRSERPWDDAYSLPLMVEDIEALRRAWGVEQIALVGHSFGTILGLEYAAAHPERVAKLVLVAGVPDIPAAIDDHCDRLATLDPALFAEAVAARPAGATAKCNSFSAGRAFIDGAMYPDPATMALVDATDAEGGLRNTGQIGAALFGAGGLMDYRFDRHERLTMPVLAVAGLEDHQATVGPQRALVGRLADGRIVEMAGRGHFLFVEDPDGFARVVTDFLTAP